MRWAFRLKCELGQPGDGSHNSECQKEMSALPQRARGMPNDAAENELGVDQDRNEDYPTPKRSGDFRRDGNSRRVTPTTRFQKRHAYQEAEKQLGQAAMN